MFDAGDLVMIPFPFSDLSATKRRPVLIFTGPDQQGDFMACPITSRAGWQRSRRLLPTDLDEGVLPLASWVRIDKVVTLHSGLIVRRLGRVSGDFRQGVARAICHVLHGSAHGPTP